MPRRLARPRARNYDAVAELVAERVEKTQGQDLGEAAAAGRPGGGLCGVGAELPAAGRGARRRCGAGTITVVGGRRCGRRVSTWSSTGACWAGCTCSARCWPGRGSGSCASPTTSARTRRWRCWRSASRSSAGCPSVVLADRMGCLKGGVVANVVVPTADYVRFAAHYGFRPDFCEAADPESKGIVENLVGYAKTDLMVPGADGSGEPFADLAAANAAAAAWCAEVNAAVHSRDLRGPGRAAGHRAGAAGPAAVAAGQHRPAGDPQGRPAVLRPVRLGPLLGADPADRRPGRGCTSTATGAAGHRGPATGEVVAEHPLVAPGEASILDEHYGGPRPAPRRAVRPKTAAEKAFCALGPTAEAFITGAAAAGNTRLGPELAELITLRAAHGDQAVPRRAGPGGRVRPLAGRRRPLHPRRRRRDTAAHARPGTPWCSSCPRSRPGRCPTTPSTAPPRDGSCREHAPPPALAAGPGRRAAPAEAGRDAPPRPRAAASPRRPNAGPPRSSCAPWSRPRSPPATPPTPAPGSRPPAFPVTKTLDEFDLAVSSIPPATFDYLASLEWIPRRENLCLVGPAGTGKCHLLVALGVAAVASRAPGPLLHRRRARRDPLPRPGRQHRRPGHRHPAPQRPDHLSTRSGSPRWTTPAPNCCSGSSPPPTNAAPSASPRHWPFESWGRFLPEHTTAVSLLDRLLHHANVVVTGGTQSCS